MNDTYLFTSLYPYLIPFCLPGIIAEVNGDVSLALYCLHHSDRVVVRCLEVAILVGGSHLQRHLPLHWPPVCVSAKIVK